ncbi:MAG: riboflavin synthase [Desulfonauticus sp.]|nr:riboflavin synthase [Desulfonauticus sp.]
MFTGIIQDVGRIEEVRFLGSEQRLTIKTSKLADFSLGESIAVNGVCLTVENFTQDRFQVYASKETLEKTNLKFLKTGDLVNLERALTLSDRLGGHFVSGHIDCLGQVKKKQPVGESILFEITLPQEFAPYVIPKGSIALDGISLTVNTCSLTYFTVNIIPATQKETTILNWQPGYRLNIETDVIGKYVHRFLSCSGTQTETSTSKISLDFLQKHGF